VTVPFPWTICYPPSMLRVHTIFSIYFPFYPKLFVTSIFSLISSFLFFDILNLLSDILLKSIANFENASVYQSKLRHSVTFVTYQSIYRLASGTAICLIHSQHSSGGIVTRL
jgi:hypothetical protein